MAQSPYAWIFFVIYILISSFMVLNRQILAELRSLRAEVAELRGATPARE